MFGAIRASTGTQPNVFQFTGEQVDPSTGFEYLRARYYDQAIGRFLSRDTVYGVVENPSSQNLFTYALSRPVLLLDPTGHVPGPVIPPGKERREEQSGPCETDYVQGEIPPEQCLPLRVRIGFFENHHLLPKEFKPLFNRAGLNINEQRFISRIPRDLHKDLHGIGGGEKFKNSWNKQWERFFRNNPNPTKAEILRELERLRKMFGLP